MNNTFDIRRFGFLIKKIIYEKGLILGGSFVLLVVLMLLIYGTSSAVKQSSLPQNACFGLGLISPTVFVSILLNHFSRKSSAVAYLTLPCSHFEKWLTIFMLTVFIYLPLFLLTFKLIDTVFLNHYREVAVTKFQYMNYQLESDLPYLKYTFQAVKGVMPFSGFMACFFGLSGATVLGTLYFNQKSYIKTALVLVGFFIVFGFLANTLFGIIIGESTSTGIFTFDKALVTNESKRQFSVEAPEAIKNLVKYFLLVFIPAALWLIGLVRLRDREL